MNVTNPPNLNREWAENNGGIKIFQGSSADVWKMGNVIYKFPLERRNITQSEIKISQLMSEHKIGPTYLGGLAGSKGFIALEFLPYTMMYDSGMEQDAELQHNLLTTIAKMHKVGVVHGDLHGQNVLFCQETKNIRIIDFGDSVTSSMSVSSWKSAMALELKEICYNIGALFGDYEHLSPQRFINIVDKYFPSFQDYYITRKNVNNMWKEYLANH